MGEVCGGCYCIGRQAMMEEKKLARKGGRETGCEPSCRGCVEGTSVPTQAPRQQRGVLQSVQF